MKDKDFGNEIKFKELADKIKTISESGVFDLFDENADDEVFERFGEILSEELSKPYEPVTAEEIYEELVDNFFILIKELGIEKFNFFRFSNYDYPREVIIDGKEYDLDGEFCHDDEDATGALCAIDCLMGDLGYDEETILKKAERLINIRNMG